MIQWQTLSVADRRHASMLPTLLPLILCMHCSTTQALCCHVADRNEAFWRNACPAGSKYQSKSDCMPSNMYQRVMLVPSGTTGWTGASACKQAPSVGLMPQEVEVDHVQSGVQQRAMSTVCAPTDRLRNLWAGGISVATGVSGLTGDAAPSELLPDGDA